MDLTLLARSLHGRHDWRGHRARRALCAAKYLWRSLRRPRLHGDWLRFVRDTPLLTAMLARDPRLLERAQHPYISRRLPVARRYAILQSHYRLLLARLPGPTLEAVLLHGALPLGTLALKDGSLARLELRPPTGRGREGELALYLLDASGQSLCSLIFTLADDGCGVLVGCVQGAAAGLGREAVRAFTRQAWGLRPKNLLLSMLYALAAHVGAEQVRGVGNAAHPFAGQPHKIKADYDAFWLECQGTPGADGFYELPPREAARDESQVESKHRSAFRRREALRQEACHLLLRAIAPPLARAA
jgi:uncharacterized protein VirK/YbjX